MIGFQRRVNRGFGRAGMQTSLTIFKQIKVPLRRQLLHANLSREIGYHYFSEGETEKGIAAPDTTLLEYFVAGDQMILWVIDRATAAPLRRLS